CIRIETPEKPGPRTRCSGKQTAGRDTKAARRTDGNFVGTTGRTSRHSRPGPGSATIPPRFLDLSPGENSKGPARSTGCVMQSELFDGVSDKVSVRELQET